VTGETGRTDPLLTIGAVSKWLHLSAVSLYRNVQAGTIPGYKICGSWRFNRVEMAATASLDRLFHKAHIFNIDGHSYRLKDFNQTMKGAHLE